MKKLGFRGKLGLLIGTVIVLSGSFITRKNEGISTTVLVIGIALVVATIIYVNYGRKKV